ncbi:MAG: A24 family peptidase, partial [Pseudomonadota bacterium]
PEMPLHVIGASIVLAGILIWISATDLKEFIIPDAASVSLILSGLIAVSMIDLGLLATHALGAAMAWMVFALVSRLFLSWRGYEGLGLGDAKLAAGAAVWIGPWAMPSMVLMASLLAIASLLLAKRLGSGSGALNGQSGIAFGPFLALSTWVTWIYGPVV